MKTLRKNQTEILEIKNLMKENKLASIGNRADLVEESISDIKERYLEMMQKRKETDLNIKKKKELYKNYLTPLESTI